ncbi:MAG: hypothetical protein Q8928_12235 [Bacteroidota bacterium]|nr:hypothetical protein [Bacteroidota bacterium]
MKKILLVLTVLFVSISSSFAYEQTLTACGNVVYTDININTDTYNVSLDCTFSGSGQYCWGDVQCVEIEANGNPVNNSPIYWTYAWNYDGTSTYDRYQMENCELRYTGIIRLFLETDGWYECYCEAKVSWNI